MEYIKKLGRAYKPDSRDRNYPLAAKLPSSVSSKKYKYWWDQAWWGDQGNYPHCVAYSWMHWLEDGPTTHFYKKRDFDPHYLNENRKEKHQPLFDPIKIYSDAQKVDEWQGENYEGTSVRAGAKVLQKLGVISEYRWAYTIDDIINALLYMGPVVVGTWWHYDMFFPDKNGLIKATGTKVGGHAYLLNGINLNKGLIRIKNSWGKGWGKGGYAYISINDFAKLLSDQGEACMAFEKKLE